MFFNEDLGPEDINKEYKLGFMYWDREFKSDIALELLLSGKWLFNDSIYNTIKEYLIKYLPKYIASFTHPLSKVEKGVLYIGIDDNGLVKGIPFKGNISLDTIKPIIADIFKNKIKFPNKEVMKFLHNNISIEIIKLKHDFNKTNKKWFDEQLEQHFNKKQKSMRDYNHRKIWLKLIKEQNGKLNKFLNKEKTFFRNYLFDRDILSKRKYKHQYSHLEYLIDVPNYYDLIADIKIKNFKSAPDDMFNLYYDFVKNGTHTNLPYYEFNNIITLFLFGRYKDFYTDLLKANKPKNITFYNNEYFITYLLSNIDKMNSIWVTSNRNINLFVIKITMPDKNLLKNLIKEQPIIYYNSKKRKYEECFREVNETGPITVIV